MNKRWSGLASVLLFLFVSVQAFATPAVMPYPRFRAYVPGTSTPLVGGKLYTYLPGTSTPQATYTDSTGAAYNTNPVILDANGEADVWYTGNLRFVLRDDNDVIVWTRDNVPPNTLLPSSFNGSGGRISGYNIGALAGTDNGVFNYLTVSHLIAADFTIRNQYGDNTGTMAGYNFGWPGVYHDNGTFNVLDVATLKINGIAFETTPGYANLKVTTTGGADNVAVVLTADWVKMINSSNQYVLRQSITKNVHLDVAGAGGLDTGTVAANTGYYLYVIDNGTTTVGLFSLSATSPTMPTTYTYKYRVGWVTTDATGTPFKILDFTQIDDLYLWHTKPRPISNSGTSNTTTAVSLAAGGALTYASVPAVGAKSVLLKVYNAGSVANTFFSSMTFPDSETKPSTTADFSGAINGGDTTPAELMLIEPQKFYWQTNNSVNVTADVVGFRLKH